MQKRPAAALVRRGRPFFTCEGDTYARESPPFPGYPRHGLRPRAPLHGLTSELGELGKELLKATRYGQKPFTPQPGCEEEMGDCLFSLLALCCEMGLDASKALDAALKKYEARYALYGHTGSER